MIKLSIVKEQTSFKVWEGPSRYDGSEIVAIITNVGRPSKNPKTGPMSQLWILPKNEVPYKAVKYEGGDDGICGDCIYTPLRARRAIEDGHKLPSCYVGRRSHQAPTSIWRAHIDKPVELEAGLKAIEKSGAPVRFGAYGDIAMIPPELVRRIYEAARKGTNFKKSHTAYTHQYNRAWASWARTYAMASVNNEYDAKLFRSMHWRTFRITEKPEAGPDEIICPNFTHGTTCVKCGLCDGSRGPEDKRKSITIPAH